MSRSDLFTPRLGDFQPKDPDAKPASHYAKSHDVPDALAFELARDSRFTMAEAKWAIWYYGLAESALRAVPIVLRLRKWPTPDEVNSPDRGESGA